MCLWQGGGQLFFLPWGARLFLESFDFVKRIENIFWKIVSSSLSEFLCAQGCQGSAKTHCVENSTVEPPSSAPLGKELQNDANKRVLLYKCCFESRIGETGHTSVMANYDTRDGFHCTTLMSRVTFAVRERFTPKCLLC